MMWIQTVLDAFSLEGPIAKAMAGFEPRKGQIEMAKAVAHAIENSEVLAVEAGTGVGKTFAYLIPALLSGRRLLVSTATKTLQDQLFERDLPRLLKALHLNLRVAKLKGRNNYLCTYRLAMTQEKELDLDAQSIDILRTVKVWSTATKTGDLSEIEGLTQHRSNLSFWVSSNRDNCLGSQCPDFKTCHLQNARKQALAADLLVINHHIYFADLSVRESGIAELLPSVDVAIFDEAHALNDIGVQFLGQHVSSFQLLDWARDTLLSTLQWAKGMAVWQDMTRAIEKAVQDLRIALGHWPLSHGGHVRLPLLNQQLAPKDADEQALAKALDTLKADLSACVEAIDHVQDLHPELIRLFERGQHLLKLLEQWGHSVDKDHVQWIELGRHWKWTCSPLDASLGFQHLQEKPRSWIFTSATLGDENQLNAFRKPLGLEHAKPLVVESPFEWQKQAALWVPDDLPPPSDDDHFIALIEKVWPFIEKLNGRTLFLTTTLRNVEKGAQWLERKQASSFLDIGVQGRASKNELLKQFAQASLDKQKRGAILLASISFWEGIDLPGHMLQLVVLDKLPFSPPHDPIQEARDKRVRLQGGQPFVSLSLPQAAILLKQGAGRLIRTEKDLGMLVIGDIRLLRMNYGKRLLQALPPMKPLTSAQEAEAWVEHLVYFNHHQEDEIKKRL